MYKIVNVQKMTFNLQSTLPGYGKFDLDLKLNAIFF